MGNALVATSGDCLATVAVARSLQLNHSKLLSIRDTLSDFHASQDQRVGRPLFQLALDRASVRKHPDQKVLHLLFTMWDTAGDGRVSYQDFIVGLSPLACPNENLRSILTFSMDVMDTERSGKINGNQLVLLLKSK